MKKSTLTFLISISSCLSFAQEYQESVLSPPPPPPRSAEGGTANAEVFTFVQQMPEFPGGMDAAKRYIADNIRYPEEALERKIQGRVILKFVVTSAGKVDKVNVVRDIGGGCGKEAMRIIAGMPDWSPGRQNGRSVSVLYTLPVTFSLPDDDATRALEIVEPPVEAPPRDIAIRQNPEFPGDLHAFLAANLKYPPEAKRKGVTGKVMVRFAVEKDGTVSEARTLHDIGGGCGEEALRVVRQMPKWKPALQQGQPVKSYYTLPVNFTLIERKKEKK